MQAKLKGINVYVKKKKKYVGWRIEKHKCYLKVHLMFFLVD